MVTLYQLIKYSEHTDLLQSLILQPVCPADLKFSHLCQIREWYDGVHPPPPPPLLNLDLYIIL